MALGLALLFFWARSEVKGGQPPMGLAVGFVTLAAAPWVSAIIVGNHPLLVVPLLAMSYWLLKNGQDWAAGILLGMALLKPSLAGPFFLVFLLRRSWSGVTACVAYVVFASLVTWRLTATDPLEMLGQMFAASKQFVDQGYGPAQYLMQAGMPTQAATVSTAISFTVLGCWALFLARHGTLLAQFSLAAITARLWAYHQSYDDAVVLFALVFFARETLGSHLRIAITGFLLSTITLWMPFHAALLAPVRIFQLTAWLVLAYLIVKLSNIPGQPPRRGTDGLFVLKAQENPGVKPTQRFVNHKLKTLDSYRGRRGGLSPEQTHFWPRQFR